MPTTLEEYIRQQMAADAMRTFDYMADAMIYGRGMTKMGCNIHAYRERKLPDGSWECLEEFDPIESEEWGRHYLAPKTEDRDYALYGLLAKVSCEYAISWDPRGFPEDASAPILQEYEHQSGDAHTPSWLTSQELMEMRARLLLKDQPASPNWPDPNWRGSLAASLGEFTQALEFNPSTKDQRVVFWFDN